MLSLTRPDYGALNTQDLWKCLALITMVIDHVGAFLYQDELWLRVIGRVAFPIWFFLAGYRTNFSLRADVALGAALMILLDVLTGWSLLPLDILWNYLCTVFLLGLIHKKQLLKQEPWSVVIACAVFLPVSFIFLNYGLMGLVFALCGYMMRHAYAKPYVNGAMAAAAMLHAAIEVNTLDYVLIQQLCVAAVIGVTVFGLRHFSRRDVSGAPVFAGAVTKHISRHALHYYVLHLWMIQWIAYSKSVTPF